MRDALRARIVALIEGGPDDDARDALLADLRRHQASQVPAYGRLVAARGEDAAMPTDVFRFTRVAVHPPGDDVATFRTSGTTHGARGSHHFRELALYDLAARTWAARMLFARPPKRLVVLAPSPAEAPDSSLSHMLGRFGEWFAPATFCWRDGPDLGAFAAALEGDEPVGVLGTSFALVHACDGSATRPLPPGSFLMQTGGFKGRSRTLELDAMRALLRGRFGLDDPQILGEYGMTELSSQAYERAPGRYRFPHWVRASLVDPETLERTTDEGLLRIDDAANLDSCCAIQTSDLARIEDGDVILLGRAPGAVPRGCSLAAEEALGA